MCGKPETIRSLVLHHDVATMHWVHPSSSQYNGQAASRSLPSLFRREAGFHLLHGPPRHMYISLSVFREMHMCLWRHVAQQVLLHS